MWDAWRAGGLALVEAILESPDSSPSPGMRGPRFPCDLGEDSGAPACAGVTKEGNDEDEPQDRPPIEYKSAPSGRPARRRNFSPLDRVTTVNAGVTLPPSGTGVTRREGVANSLWRGGGNPL